ncbi:MAG: tandem-95 repeat protein [Methanosarcinales archaeon]|nr:tandem-95 repeat protein [Methanosarcinales archaeon]
MILRKLLIFTFIITASIIVVEVGAADDGLVAEWNFEEGSGNTLKDNSGNGNDGTIYGATWTTDGKFGSALQFDGVNDYVEIPNSPELSGGSGKNKSIEFWFNTNKQSGHIITKWQSISTKDWGASIGAVGPGLFFWYESGGRDRRFYGGTIEEGIWHHGAFTFQRSTGSNNAKVILYLDGEELDVINYDGVLPNRLYDMPYSSVPVSIGYSGKVYNNGYFDGKIDEIKVYDRVLSSEEIKNEYDKLKNPRPYIPSDTNPPLSGKIVIINPGHGLYKTLNGEFNFQRSYYEVVSENDVKSIHARGSKETPTGAVDVNNALVEDKVVVKISSHLKKYLEQNGATVYSTRDLNIDNSIKGMSGYPRWEEDSDIYLNSVSFLNDNSFHDWINNTHGSYSYYAKLCSPIKSESDIKIDGRRSRDLTIRWLYANYIRSNNPNKEIYYVGVHTNGVDSASHGTETWYDQTQNDKFFKDSYGNDDLAKSIQGAVIEKFRSDIDPSWIDRKTKVNEDRPPQQDEIGELYYNNNSAALIEVAFHDNITDNQWLLQDNFIKAAAEGILEGLNGKNGLYASYYSKAIYRENINAIEIPFIERIDPKIDFDWQNDPLPINKDGWWSVDWTGFISAPEEGTYSFKLNSDDGSWLFIDGELVVDNGGDHPPREVSGEIDLTKGYHSIHVKYFNSYGGQAKIELYWKPPGESEYKIVPSDVLFISPPVKVAPIMHLSKNAPASMDQGYKMIYTMYYHNFGTIPASNVELKDILPPEVDYISASDGGTFDDASKTVTWTIDSVPALGRGSRTVIVRIPSDVPIDTVIQNTASISYDNNPPSIASTQTKVTKPSLPPDVKVEPSRGTTGGTPSIYWRDPITFSYRSCDSATGVDIRIHVNDGGPDILGTMAGGPPDWTYTTTFYPRHGRATITYTVYGCEVDTVSFDIYIDPAGYIYDADTGERIASATVWLQWPDGDGGWVNVPTGEDPAISQPDVNPLITGEDGWYQWDVLEGSYRVHVEADGYYPEDSIVVSIPPPVFDLHVGLTQIPSENKPPVATDDSATTMEDTAVAINVSINDIDVDGNLDPMTANTDCTTCSGPAHGTLTNHNNGTFTYTPDPDYNGPDSFIYEICDTEGLCNTATVTIDVTAVNDAPIATDDSATTLEDTAVAIDVIVNDNDVDGNLDPTTANTDCTTCSGPAHGTLTNHNNGTFTYTPDPDYNGPDSFTYEICDTEGLRDTALVNIDVTAVNDAPVVSVDVTEQTVQYSDGIADITISTTDVDSSSLTISTSWTKDGGDVQSDLPPALVLSAGECILNSLPATCVWNLEGQAVVDTGTYDVTFTISDGEDEIEAYTTRIVEPEDAVVAFDNGNPVAVQVVESGGNSQAFSLTVDVTEAIPDMALLAYPGDISLAKVSVSLEPVGPGSPAEPTSCSLELVGTGYDEILTVTCDFNDVVVNTYTVKVTVDGDYYTGSGEDVVVIYDPSLGFTTGGGTFLWPETGEKTNFGYTMKYNKKATNIKGNLLLVRHLEDGTIYRVKSNALYGLALGESEEGGETFGWASFSGKSTYLEPGWDEPIGNYEFITYVEDHGEPGKDIDRIWIKVMNQGNTVDVMSMDDPGANNAVVINGGNIVVPHQ